MSDDKGKTLVDVFGVIPALAGTFTNMAATSYDTVRHERLTRSNRGRAIIDLEHVPFEAAKANHAEWHVGSERYHVHVPRGPRRRLPHPKRSPNELGWGAISDGLVELANGRPDGALLFTNGQVASTLLESQVERRVHAHGKTFFPSGVR